MLSPASNQLATRAVPVLLRPEHAVERGRARLLQLCIEIPVPRHRTRTLDRRVAVAAHHADGALPPPRVAPCCDQLRKRSVAHRIYGGSSVERSIEIRIRR